MNIAPKQDSDQPGHPSSLIRVFAVCVWVAYAPNFLHAGSEYSDQNERMSRFAGRKGHFIGFVMLGLKSQDSFFFSEIKKKKTTTTFHLVLFRCY